MLRTFIVFAVLLTLVYPTVTHADDVVLDWNATLRAAVQSDGLMPINKANPGWSTRSIAMMNGAIYDVFQGLDRQYRPFMSFGKAGPDTSLQAAVHQAAYEILLHCYPDEASDLLDDYNDRMALVPDSVSAKTNGMNFGHTVAEAYMTKRTEDHSGDAIPYMPLSGPGKWRSDPWNPGQTAWGPGWGTVHPFAISNTQDLIDALPLIPDMSTPAYRDAFDMVYKYGAIDSTDRTEDQEEIGLFWAYDRPSMGPPPVLFIRNLEEIAAAIGNSPAENARMFAMASVAQADAAIAAWDAKFEYNFWRPVAAIHEADTDGNIDTDADPSWRPLGAPGNDPGNFTDDFTPPFPAWTSGHATMGGAVFKAIELFYGTNDFEIADGDFGNDLVTTEYMLTSEEAGSGGARMFNSFTQTGILDVGTENSPEGENGMSRIYLGIHWIFDQQDGIMLGNNIANYVFDNYFFAVPEPGTLILAMGGLPLAIFIGRRRRLRVQG